MVFMLTITNNCQVSGGLKYNSGLILSCRIKEIIYRRKRREKELEDGRQRITELDGLVKKQRDELDILRREAAEARRLAAKWKMPQEIYGQLVGILEERREKETRQMEETADRWADGIHADGMTWEDIRRQADSYKQHRKQAGVCGNILRVLKRYEEEKEG